MSRNAVGLSSWTPPYPLIQWHIDRYLVISKRMRNAKATRDTVLALRVIWREAVVGMGIVIPLKLFLRKTLKRSVAMDRWAWSQSSFHFINQAFAPHFIIRFSYIPQDVVCKSSWLYSPSWIALQITATKGPVDHWTDIPSHVLCHSVIRFSPYSQVLFVTDSRQGSYTWGRRIGMTQRLVAFTWWVQYVWCFPFTVYRNALALTEREE